MATGTMELLLLEDPDPALQHVFAFIDSFDDLQRNLEAQSNPPPAASSPGTPMISPKPRGPARPNRGAKKRAQLQALREEVAALEDRLVRTRKAQSPVAQRLDRNTRLWLARTLAREENRRRQHSEARNLQLKSVLLEQHQVARQVRYMLRAVTTYAKLEKMLQTPERGASSLRNYVPNFEDMILNELVLDMTQLHLNTDNVFSGVGSETGMAAFYNRLESKRDPTTGVTYVEAMNSTYIATGMKQAGHDLQRFTTALLNKRGAFRTKLGMLKRGKTQLANRDTTVSVNVRGLAKFYEGEERMLFATTSVMFQHPNDDAMRFRKRAWLLLTPSSMGPEHGCVFRVCYRLCPAIEMPTDSSTAVDKTREFVMQTMSALMTSSFFTDIAEVLRVSGDIEAAAAASC